MTTSASSASADPADPASSASPDAFASPDAPAPCAPGAVGAVNAPAAAGEVEKKHDVYLKLLDALQQITPVLARQIFAERPYHEEEINGQG